MIPFLAVVRQVGMVRFWPELAPELNLEFESVTNTIYAHKLISITVAKSTSIFVMVC